MNYIYLKFKLHNNYHQIPLSIQNFENVFYLLFKIPIISASQPTQQKKKNLNVL